MAEFTMQITPPEKVDLTISGPQAQQITLEPTKVNTIVFDYEGDVLIFQGDRVRAIASLKTISDVFWMTLSLTSKGFEVSPNEPKEMFERIFDTKARTPQEIMKKFPLPEKKKEEMIDDRPL